MHEQQRVNSIAELCSEPRFKRMWLFRRNEERLTHELRKNGSGYELVIGYHDGWVDVERFPDAGTAAHYALDLRRALKDLSHLCSPFEGRRTDAADGGWQPSFFVDGQAAPL